MEADEVAALQQLSHRVCESAVAYAGAQLEGDLDSMQLLEQVVSTLQQKYTKMQSELQSVGKLSKIIKSKARAMTESVQYIAEIDEELTELEEMVDQLDQYTSTLQNQFYQVR